MTLQYFSLLLQIFEHVSGILWCLPSAISLKKGLADYTGIPHDAVKYQDAFS